MGRCKEPSLTRFHFVDACFFTVFSGYKPGGTECNDRQTDGAVAAAKGAHGAVEEAGAFLPNLMVQSKR